MQRICLWALALAATAALMTGPARAFTPEGIVFEAEAVSEPADAWLKDKRVADKWMLWTREEAIERKRSGSAVLASPTVTKDREKSEEGAPPLHSVVTGLEPGTYLVFASNPGHRPLAYSLDGETWQKHTRSEFCFGARALPEGRFECWVDDRYAHPSGSPGPGYYDYLRFVRVPDSANKVTRYSAWKGIDTDGTVELSVPASDTVDWQGFEAEGSCIRASAKGSKFSYILDRAGRFYIALVMQDDVDGIEQLVATLDGEEVGCAVGAQQSGPALFSFTEPLEVKEGDRLTFTCGTDVPFYRVYSLHFAAEPILPPPPTFHDMAAWCTAPGEVEFCWTTSMSVPTGRVRIRDMERGEERTTEPSTYVGRNHRVFLSDLHPGAVYAAHVITEHEGAAVESREFRFAARPPEPPVTQAFSVPLAIAEPTDQGRRPWPVTIGVPFPEGKLGRVEDLRVFNSANEGVPLQASRFSSWRDGSVKWATLSFQADTIRGAGAPDWRLEARPQWPAASPSVKPTVQVSEDEAAWHVRTGTLAFDVRKECGDLFQDLALVTPDGTLAPVPTGEAAGSNLALATAADGELACGAPETFTVEKNGGIRAIIKWDGPFVKEGKATGWRYLVRVTLWSGEPAMKVNVTVLNDRWHERFSFVKSFGARVPFGGEGVTASLEGKPFTPVDDEPVVLFQDQDTHFAATGPGEDWQGTRASGLVTAKAGGVRATVMPRYFWQTYPSACGVSEAGVHLEFLPGLTPEQYLPNGEDPDFYKLFAWWKDGMYALRAGQITQQEFTVRFDPPDSVTPSSVLAAWHAHPLLPQAPPKYLCDTAAVLGCAVYPETPGVWDCYEKFFAAGFENLAKDREARRTYGWQHFGDWYGERTCNYGNNEYDLGWSAGVQWMRTGNRAYLERGLEMALHHSTVDTMYGQGTGRRRGIVWEHCFNHAGTPLTPDELHAPADDKGFASYMKTYKYMFGGAIDPQGHVFQEGNWFYAAVTGDPWFRDAAEHVCTNQAVTLTPNFNFTIERSGAWPLINAMAAYRFSGNPFYLNAGRIMVERIIERQDPESGGWLHYPPIGETGGVRVLGGKAFAVGMLTHSLIRYLEQEPEPERREVVRGMLVRGADWLMNESWNPGKGFRYITNAPNHRDTGGRGITCTLCAEVIAFGYDETGDEKYLDFWKEMMQGVMDVEPKGMGKSFTQWTRQTVFGLDRVAKHGVTSGP